MTTEAEGTTTGPSKQGLAGALATAVVLFVLLWTTTSAAAAAGPVNTVLPTISGTTTQGDVLSASIGMWNWPPTTPTSTPTYAYQWLRCNLTGGSCQRVAGGTTSFRYLLGAGDVASTMRVAVTARNSSGSASATSAATAPIVSPTDPVVVAVGDISCPAGDTTHSCKQATTEMLAHSFSPTSVFVLGDNQYNSGSFSEYESAGAYNATWGVFNPIVRPVPGNHEYGTAGAAGYFSYFGQTIANPENTPYGYYSFNIGSWHIVALNSNCSNSDVGKSGCPDALAGNTTSAQTSWLQSDLAANSSGCVLAMWHHPQFSSGFTGGSPGVAPLWNALYNAHADVVLGGHDHLYERYAQLDPSGNATTNGIREFVVGTGGESLFSFSSIGLQPQVHDVQFGVLVLTLHAGSYSWKFVTTSGTIADSGSTVCHRASAAPAVAAAAHLSGSARMARLRGAPLAFDVHPLPTSLRSMMRSGIPVAVQSSRAVDVTVTIWLRRNGWTRRIVSAYETESQIAKPYSRILLRVPAHWLKHAVSGALVMRFAAVDAAEHHQTLMRTVQLR